MKENPLRVALFGAGGYAAHHVEIVEKFQAAGVVRFVAVADPAADKLGDLKPRLESAGVRWFFDYGELLGALNGQLDAVVIATPIPHHLPMLEAAFERGIAIFLEKPPVPLIQDFLRLAARPEAARVAVGFKLVADPALWHLKRMMLGGALGKIRRISGMACWPRLDSYYGRASWSGRLAWKGMPVLDGPATNAMAHFVHHMMFLAGEDEGGFAVPETVRAELYRARPIESYDACCLAGNWKSGVEFSAAFVHAVEERIDWTITVEGEKGDARLTRSGLAFDGAPGVPSPPGGDIFRLCWLDFLEFARGRVPKPLTSFADCRGYVAATNAMFLSSGAIHSLPGSAVRRFERENDGGYDIAGIVESAAQVAKTGRLFSEQGLPWAVPGKPVASAGLADFPLGQFLPETIRAS